MHDMHQDTNVAEMATKNVNVVRLKVFNFHSVKSIITAKLRENSQKSETCDYKIDTGSDGNLMSLS